MTEIKITKNDKGEEEVRILAEFNIGKLYRIEKGEQDLVMTFNSKLIKRLMMESIQGWAKRDYTMYDIEETYEEMYGKDMTERQKDNTTMVLDILREIEFKKDDERLEAIKAQMETYAYCYLMELLDVEAYPIRLDENKENKLMGFKGEVKIIK